MTQYGSVLYLLKLQLSLYKHINLHVCFIEIFMTCYVMNFKADASNLFSLFGYTFLT